MGIFDSWSTRKPKPVETECFIKSIQPDERTLEVLASGIGLYYSQLIYAEWINWSIDYNNSSLTKISSPYWNPKSIVDVYEYQKCLTDAAKKCLKEKKECQNKK